MPKSKLSKKDMHDLKIEGIARFIENFPKAEWDKFKGRQDVADLIRRSFQFDPRNPGLQ